MTNNKLKKLIAEYISRKRTQQLSRFSVSTYQENLNQFAKFVEAVGSSPERFNYKLVRDYVLFKAICGSKGSTIRTRLNAVQYFFDFLLEEGYIKENYCKGVVIKIAKTLPNVVPPGELKKIYDQIRANSGDLKHLAIFDLIYCTGLTLNQIIELKISDVDLFSKTINVWQQRGKMFFTLPIPDSLVDTLKSYLEMRSIKWPESVYFFPSERGNQLDRKTIYDIVRGFLSKASTLKKGSFTLRQSLIAHLFSNGATTQEVAAFLNVRAASLDKFIR